MGKPKFSRKKYETPSHPWQEDRIKAENEIVKKYGLKNKREIWKAQTKLKKYRGQTRELLAKVGTSDVQSKKESDQLLMHLNRMNILPPNSNLDDVLALETESILARRLQTLTYLKGLSSTPDQARQLISHGHIAIEDRKVTVPSYMVTKDEESKIGYTTDSSLNDLMHPARPRADYKSVPQVRTEKPVEKKEEPPKDKEAEEKPAEDKKEEKSEESQPDAKDEKPEETAPEPEKPVEEPPKEETSPAEPEKPAEGEQPTEEPKEEKTEEPAAESEQTEKVEDKPKEEEKKEGGN